MLQEIFGRGPIQSLALDEGLGISAGLESPAGSLHEALHTIDLAQRKRLNLAEGVVESQFVPDAALQTFRADGKGAGGRRFAGLDGF